jgi:hypothetical protein
MVDRGDMRLDFGPRPQKDGSSAFYASEALAVQVEAVAIVREQHNAVAR